MAEQMYLTHILSVRHLIALFGLRTLDSTSALCWVAILNSKTMSRNDTHENVALHRPWKGHLFTEWDLNQEGRESSCYTLGGNMSGDSMQVCEWLWKHRDWFGHYRYILVSRKFTNQESTRNEGGLYKDASRTCLS